MMNWITVALNNLAVEMHKEGLYGDATTVYNEAVESLRHDVARTNDNHERSTGDVAEATEREWALVLERRKEEFARRQAKRDSSTPPGAPASVPTFSPAVGTNPRNGHQLSNRRNLAEEHKSLSEPIILDPMAQKYDSEDLTGAAIIYNISLSQAEGGKLEKAQRLLELSMNLQESPRGGGDVLTACLGLSSRYNMALLHHSMGNERQAFHWMHDALVFGLEFVGHHSLVASVIHTLGHMFFVGGDLQAADVSFQESRRMFDRFSVDACSRELSFLCSRDGDFAPAA